MLWNKGGIYHLDAHNSHYGARPEPVSVISLSLVSVVYTAIDIGNCATAGDYRRRAAVGGWLCAAL